MRILWYEAWWTNTCLGRYFTSRNAISILSFEHCRNVSPVNTIMAPKWVDLRHSLLQKLVADFYTIMQIIISLLGKVYNHTPIIKHLFDFPDKKKIWRITIKIAFLFITSLFFFLPFTSIFWIKCIWFLFSKV